MKIINDQLMSECVSDEMEYHSGSFLAYDACSEDHLVTLDIGIRVHVFMNHGEKPTEDDVVMALYQRAKEPVSDRSMGSLHDDF